jgi:hypothetical protein
MNFRVHLLERRKGQKPIKVTADYFVVDDGRLIFRNANRAGYPIPVRVFAAGVWRDVENILEG